MLATACSLLATRPLIETLPAQVQWRDNQPTLELIEGRPNGVPGILVALDDATYRASADTDADTNLLNELHKNFAGGERAEAQTLDYTGLASPCVHARCVHARCARHAPCARHARCACSDQSIVRAITCEGSSGSGYGSGAGSALFGHGSYARPKLGSRSSFCVIHYAGEVMYDVVSAATIHGSPQTDSHHLSDTLHI